MGISQAELGLRIGLDRGVASTRINRYERAVHLPDFETIERLAKHLEVPMAHFFASEEELAALF